MIGCGSTTAEAPPPASAPAVAEAPAPVAPPPKGPLYDRLGGEPAVGAVVDEFLKRVAGDARITVAS
ncbi:MAG: hypothetical protein ABUS79_00340 [Pseudomonadota bacterium]